MKTLLWLDDYRDPLEGNWLVFSPIALEDIEVYWVKSYDQFVDWIINNGLPNAICFDHDLGLELNKEEKTGYDCAKWLVNHCLNNDLKLPLYNIQSANPVGKENIDKLLINFNKHYDEKRIKT